ncbi:MAG: hypothetical protein IJH55_01135 [Romboutsia sp.]|nr:hypothetical protein [Romboutsia sp.]
MINQDYGYQMYYDNIFTEINEICSDYDVLLIGTEMIKIARDRLNGDLNNNEIEKEYLKLNEIVGSLEEIKNNYV